MDSGKIPNLNDRENIEQLENVISQLEVKEEIDSELCCSFAMLLQRKGKTHEALHYFSKVLEVDVNHTIALANTGQLYNSLGKKKLAEEYLKKALITAPKNSEVCASYAGVLLSLGKYDQSLKFYEKSLELNPQNFKAYSDMLLALNYTSLDQHKVFEKHKEYSRLIGEKKKVINFYGHQKLRIAYISGDFKRHSVPYFIEGLLHFHDRQKYEVYCYSDVDKEDLITERFKDLSEHWRGTYSLTDKQVSELIRKDEVDILVDLAAHTGRRLQVFAERSAPLQITYCGYPNTSGLKNMDYRLVDEKTDPSGDEYYSEKLLRLKRCFLAFSPPDDAPEVGPLPYSQNGYITFGSFNNFNKITESVLKVWRQLLKSVPDSRLLLKSKHFNDELLRKQVKEFFAKRGIAEERIKLHGFELKLKNHLDLYNEVDIALDSFPYNGTTTTCEALYMGVPVITFRGNCHASKVGTSILSAMGLESLIGGDVSEYRKVALNLASNTELIKSLRQNMRTLMFNSSLCDSLSLTREIEDKIEHIFKSINVNN